MTRRLLLVLIASLVCVSPLYAQSIRAPKPVYLREWAEQGLTGKGVVVVTIDKKTGAVTGARMLKSTGSKLLDGSALEAFSRWRFKPGTVSEVKIPIEFANRSKP